VSYRIIIEQRILKEIKAIPKPDALRISKAINNLANNPRPHGSLKLEGEDDLYRIRIGRYRVIYTIRDQALIVIIIKIGHRNGAYR